MSTSKIDMIIPDAISAAITDDTLTVNLSDGRSISVPLTWYPRLYHADSTERKHWRLIGKGKGIHWEDLDEDISVEGLLSGKPSGESQESFQKWLKNKRKRLHEI